MKSELKPCPFCGGESILTENTICMGHGSYAEEYFVKCKTCRARGSANIDYNLTTEQCKDLAKEAWNRRVDNDRREAD